MKTMFLRGLLAIGLALAIRDAQAGMMQFSGGNSPQQFGGSTSTGISQPVFIGRGYGFEGNPTPMAQFAQPGHSIVHALPMSNQNVGSRQGDFHRAGEFGRREGFDHDRFRHHHSIIVFVNGTPCWYPVYTAYPYYSDVPPPVTDSSVNYPSDGGYAPPTDTSASDYGDVGASWGQDLRREVATWDQFVAYLKTYIVVAAPADQAEFREAFIDAYRINGAVAYDKASIEAAGAPIPPPSGPKIINISPTHG